MSAGFGRTEEGATAFLAEQRMVADRRRARKLWFEQAGKHAWGRLQSWWQRLARRAHRR